MTEPLITTVIPTFRRPRMLRRAIRSVLSQTFPDFRLCIYDNASGDETEAVAEEFCRADSRVEYFYRPKNIGMSMNFVDGANRVETPFFSFLADDDLMLPHFLEAALAGFEHYRNAALSILTTLLMSPDGYINDAHILRWTQGVLPAPNGVLETIRHGNPGLQAMMFRTDIWRALGGFDLITDPACELDLDFRIMARYPVVVSHAPGAIQILHRESSTANQDLSWVWPCYPRIISRLDSFDLPADVLAEAKQRMTSWVKRRLVRGFALRAVVDRRWSDAEKVAALLHNDCGEPAAARFVRMATALGRWVPVVSPLCRTAFAARSAQKWIHNLGLQSRFRPWKDFYRSFMLEHCAPASS